jgi:hypothetical protein
MQRVRRLYLEAAVKKLNILGVHRVDGSDQLTDIVTGLVVPTGLITGPDGALYLSNFGAAPPGLGQILRVELTE